MTHRLRDLLITAARLAGEVQKGFLAGGRDAFDLEHKYETGTSADFVTKADIESEKALRAYFREVMPEYNVLGEEFGGEYDGNGKVILTDPLDGTQHFREGRSQFGPIIGVYEHGRNVGGIEYNVHHDVIYVATKETGFEQIGSPKDDWQDHWQKKAIFIGGRVHGCPDFKHDLRRILRPLFPDHPIIAESDMHDVLHRARVCADYWAAYFHAGLGRHDLAAAPIFGELTSTNVTDHNGVHYDFLDAELEVEKYKTKQNDVVSASTILVAKNPYFEKMLRALEAYKPQLDRRQVPGRRDSLKLPVLKI